MSAAREAWMTEQDNGPLVSVFETTDPALLPLAATTLEQASIDFGYQPAGAQTPVVFGHPPSFVDVEGMVEIVVRASDAARARDLLLDLQQAADGGEALGGTPAPALTPGGLAPDGARTVKIVDADSGAELGRITEDQLDFLIGQLEEESSDDRDYYIDAATVDVLASAGADAELVGLLKRAIVGREGVEIAWEEE
jgi:processive 1,2-diacylglycerol beta-glucosyltransferase